MKREELLEKWKEPVKVLDAGFVQVVDVMGDDDAVVSGARISYGSTAEEHTPEQNRALIRYMTRHAHGSPFEFPVVRFRVRLPMDVQRQFVRHRMASLNEYSTRYMEAIDGTARTEPDEWRLQATTNKQGSAGLLTEWPESPVGEFADDEAYPNWPPVGTFATLADPEPDDSNDEAFKDIGEEPPGFYLSVREKQFHDDARALYTERLAFGVAREQARKDLPLSTYTDCVYQFNYRSLQNFLKLRTDRHAQQEIRAYAEVLERFVADWLPVCHEAWLSYSKNAHTFSAQEMDALRKIVAVARGAIPWFADRVLDEAGLSKRERDEFRAALAIEDAS